MMANSMHQNMSRGKKLALLALNIHQQQKISDSRKARSVSEMRSVETDKIHDDPDYEPSDISYSSSNEDSNNYNFNNLDCNNLLGLSAQHCNVPVFVDNPNASEDLPEGNADLFQLQSIMTSLPITAALRTEEQRAEQPTNLPHGPQIGNAEPPFAPDNGDGTLEPDAVEPFHKRRKRGTNPRPAERACNRQQNIDAHGVKLPCNLQTCKKKCILSLPDEHRRNINKQFWTLDYGERRVFIRQNATKEFVKRRKNTTASASVDMLKRHYTVAYTLPTSDGNKASVCKVFFLTTLGFAKNNDTVLQNCLKEMAEASIAPKGDQRGKHVPANKFADINLIRNHVDSYHPCISHYRREHAPNRRYLPTDVRIVDMHRTFLETANIKCSYELYRRTVAEMNISFAKLGHEQCEVCEMFRLHNPGHNRNNLDMDCEACLQWSVHHKRYIAARKAYETDKNVKTTLDTCFYSADLQKVIMIPRMDTFKVTVFTKRIIAFHETFAPLGHTTLEPTRAVFSAVWHEATAGRKKDEIVSCYHAFLLKMRDVKNVVLWVDNCTAQNKNWTLFSFLAYMINSTETSSESVELRYLEKGHTFMSADSVHHEVEQSMAKKGSIYDFQDFCDAVAAVRKGKVDVKVMNVQDFSNWPNLTSVYRLAKARPRVLLQDVVTVKFTRGDFDMKYKRVLTDENFSRFGFLVKRCATSISTPDRRMGARGIPQAKKSDILVKLRPLMPADRQQFWQDIPVEDVPDLCNTCDE